MVAKIFSDEVPKELTTEESNAFQEILDMILEQKPNKKGLENIKREICKKYSLSYYPRNSDLLKFAQEDTFDQLLPYLRVRNVRSLSGVNVISVFTAPFSCAHGACIYCPGGPSWGTPMSYTGREPGAMRAISNGFDPSAQMQSRINQLMATGHNSEKLDVIIMGGTFNSTPIEYQKQFVLGVYEGMNGIVANDLQEAQRLNETAKHRCVGLTLETKPDWAKQKHIRRMLDYGATRVEIGVQTLRDDILEFVNRGHTVQDTAESFKALRDAGLKITAHMMPGLPNSTPESDIEDFRTLYYDPRFIPDEMKIYPTQVVENTPLAEMAVRGEYVGLSNEDTFHIMKEAKLMTPPFVRIKRALRDLPIPLIIDGPTWGDMRHRIQNELNQREELQCRCIRCREVGLNVYKQGLKLTETGEFQQVKRSYKAGDGTEHFLSYENEKDWLTGFLRLRYPSDDVFIDSLQDAAIVRELHVYGSALQVDTNNEKSFQHKGYGRKLLRWAEELSKEAGYEKLAVISGVGVREYYRKFGYTLEDVYMVKKL